MKKGLNFHEKTKGTNQLKLPSFLSSVQMLDCNPNANVLNQLNVESFKTLSFIQNKAKNRIRQGSDQFNKARLKKNNLVQLALQLSHTLVGCEVAYPTRQKIRQTRNMAPGTIPNASGLGDSKHRKE